MRISILILISVVIFGCGSKTPRDTDAEVITKFGIVTAKEEVDLEEAERKSRVNTGVYATISTGGRVSIGLGFLLSPFFSSSDERNPMRYEVDLLDGDAITIYHDSHDFEIDDCVEITVHPDEKRHPPTMKRNKIGC